MWLFPVAPSISWTFGTCIALKAIGNSMQHNLIRKIFSHKMHYHAIHTAMYRSVQVHVIALVIIRTHSNYWYCIWIISSALSGIKYGNIALKLIIVYIVRQYRLSTKAKLEDLKFRMNVTLCLVNDDIFELELRNSAWNA